MIIRTTWGHAEFEIDLSLGREISVRLEFDGPQPGAFGIDRATAWPYQAGDWIADTRKGASVNCYVVQLCPHGNGTHTECVGHIVDDRVAIADVLRDLLAPAWLATVPTVRRATTNDEYLAASADDDAVVTVGAINAALADCPLFVEALVLRTTPNPGAKAHKVFSGSQPTYLTSEAMRRIRERGIKHLLVDFPSVDREDDGGLLPNHRIFWDIEMGSRTTRGVTSPRTITEMIYVDDTLRDGLWCVSLEVPDFALDAAPSRIRLLDAVSIQKQ